jgi:hypothetical protein
VRRALTARSSVRHKFSCIDSCSKAFEMVCSLSSFSGQRAKHCHVTPLRVSGKRTTASGRLFSVQVQAKKVAVLGAGMIYISFLNTMFVAQLVIVRVSCSLPTSIVGTTCSDSRKRESGSRRQSRRHGINTYLCFISFWPNLLFTIHVID